MVYSIWKPPPHLVGEVEARRILEPHFDRLLEPHRGAWEYFRTLPNRKLLRSRARASVLNDLINDKAGSLLVPDHAGRFFVHGTPVYLFEGKLLLRFKKLDCCGRPRNIRTDTQKLFYRQAEIPGLPPQATHVVCGYTLDAAETTLAHVAISCLFQGRVIWSMPVQGLTAEIFDLPAHDQRASEESGVQGTRVSSKASKRSRNRGSRR